MTTAPITAPSPVHHRRHVVYWTTIGWWWAPLTWFGRAALWVVAWPLGLWRSWRHAQRVDRRRDGYGMSAGAVIVWLLKGLAVGIVALLVMFVLVAFAIAVLRALHQQRTPRERDWPVGKR